MQVVKTGSGEPIDREDRIEILVDKLIARFGADACEVVERQVDAAQDAGTRAT